MSPMVAEGGGWMPHGACYLWQPSLLWLHGVSDSLIALAYLSIPLVLLYIVRRRRDLPFNWMVVCFGVFILACGTTHALGVYNIWVPTWWLSGGVKAVTAVASLTTAGLLWRLVPDILTLPSPSQLAAANAALEDQIAERQRAEVGLRAAQANLEDRVEDRTRELGAANRALHHSEARLAGIIASAPDAIITVNEAQRIVVFNGAAERMFGCPMADALGGPLDRFIPARFRRAHTEHIRGFSQTGVTTRSMTTPGRLVALRVTDEEFPIEATISQVQTDDEKLYSVIIRDLTERERAEEVLHQTARQLQQAQKMEAVGRLAGGVAHDFNNLLTAVIGHAELALAAADPAGTVHADLERIRTAATKAAAVTGQLLTFSRKQTLDLRIVDLGRLVTELAATLHPMLGEDVRLQLSLAPDLGLVRADPALLEQVLINLTLNARDALPNGGSVTIEMANVDFAEAALVTKANLPPGAYVMLEVSDTGVGMTLDVQARIFEPFFTTKGPTKGTGLGLAMVYGIVTQSGGQISVYSEPGAGSTFKIYLPRVMAETGEPLPVPTEARPAGGTETVLLAEDNEAVRLLTERVLRSEGYAVLVAAHGYEALQLAQAHAGTIHLLLTDVMMPGMSGPRLAEELERDRPETAVLFMSGYTEQTVVERGSLREGITYLQKPFTPGVLIRRVREMLDVRPAGRDGAR
jgi:PAS domain S-box-containing protein